MATHLQKDIDELRKQLIFLGSKVVSNLENSIISVLSYNYELACSVIDLDEEIDQLEVEIEHTGLRILAIHQPVARDLRLIMAILKINTDLERIGDIAVNISKRTKKINRNPKLAFIPNDFSSCSSQSLLLLSQSLTSFVNLDLDIAEDIIQNQSSIRDLCRDMYSDIKDEISKSPEKIDILSHVLLLPRFLKRIVDHATNIAEDSIYVVNGKIIRHLRNKD